MIHLAWSSRGGPPAHGRHRVALLLQLGATGAVLGWLPGNAIKLLAMMLVWGIGFGRISRRELMLMAGVNLLFSAMDLAALYSGVFWFQHPDLLGLPIYEFFMWGFFTLHALRFVGAVPKAPPLLPSLALTALFATPFVTINQPSFLFCASSVVLIGVLAIFRDPVNFAYAGYMIAIGCLIEYIGVWTGQWAYPGPPPGGVALWFIPMWGGVGLVTGLLLGPLVYPGERVSSVPEANQSRRAEKAFGGAPDSLFRARN